MTYYTITLLSIFLLSILTFKLWKYLRSNLLVNKEILQNLEKLNKANEIGQTNISSISTQLLTIVHCLDAIVKSTQVLNIKINDLNK